MTSHNRALQRPRVLLMCLDTRSPTAPRFLNAFAEGGADVFSLARPKALAHAEVPAANRAFLRSSSQLFLIRRDLIAAHARVAPDWIVPCNENGVVALGRIIPTLTRTPAALALRDTLAHTLGRLDDWDRRVTKPAILALARQLGLATPRTIPLTSPAQAQAACQELGGSCVIKCASGTAGQATLVARSPQDAAKAYRALKPRPLVRLAEALLGIGWRAWSHEIEAQELIEGAPVMSCAVARDGRQVHVLTAEALKPPMSTGAALAARYCDLPAVAEATAKLIAGMEASGFLSFDFMLKSDGVPVVLECNARPTKMMTPAALGRDLSQALFAPQHWSGPHPLGGDVVTFHPGLAAQA